VSRERVTDRLEWREIATVCSWTSKQKQILSSLDAGLSSMEMAEIRHFPRFARADVFKGTGPAGTKSRADSMS
jgi:hypothetical protein